MIKHILAAASAIVLLAASLHAPAAPAKPASPKAEASKLAAKKAPASRPATLDIPSEISIPSSVGEVTFRHEMHIKDLSIKCADCHHQINARPLSTPHPDYFTSSWISCNTCHDEAEKVARKAYVCSECHPTQPKNIADETLSAKVVIHRQCWKCHSVGTGADASKGCAKCHSGRKKS